MIVVPEDGALRVVTQHDHARLAGEVLALWRAGGLPGHPRREELLFAAREHDNGWREADSAPRADPESGRPLGFTEVPPEVRIELWLRGARRHAERRPWAALLITHHALALHRDRRGEEPWDEELFTPLDELYEELLERIGGDPGEARIHPECSPGKAGADLERTRAEVAADYRFLDLSDALSLAACAGWTEPGERAGHRWRFRPGGREVAGELEFGPFPLAGATTFRVPCRTIPDRRYHGDADLGGELAEARWATMKLRLAPPAP